MGGQTRADSRLVLLTEVGCKDLTLVLEPSSGGSEATCLHMYCWGLPRKAEFSRDIISGGSWPLY